MKVAEFANAMRWQGITEVRCKLGPTPNQPRVATFTVEADRKGETFRASAVLLTDACTLLFNQVSNRIRGEA